MREPGESQQDAPNHHGCLSVVTLAGLAIHICNASSSGSHSPPSSEASMACCLLQGHTPAPSESPPAPQRSPTSCPSSCCPSLSPSGHPSSCRKELGSSGGTVPRKPPSLSQMKWSPLRALPGSTRQFKMRNGMVTSERQIIPAAPSKHRRKQALFCVCENGEYIVFHCLEDCFLILKSQAVFFQRDLQIHPIIDIQYRK